MKCEVNRQIGIALKSLDESKSEGDVLISMNDINKAFQEFSPEQNEDFFYQMTHQLSQHLRNNFDFTDDSIKLLYNLISKEEFISFIESSYLNPNNPNSKYIIEILFCFGYILNYTKKYREITYKLILSNPELAIKYLYKPDTSAMMLQLLLSMKDNNIYWKYEKTIENIIREFLFSGNSTIAELSSALSHVELKAWNNNIKFPLLLLDLIGFSSKMSMDIISTWEDVYDIVDTIETSILPNIKILVLLEAEETGAAVLLNYIYGIKSFARYEIKQYLDQLKLYKEESKDKPYVLSFGISDDNSGDLLSIAETVWTPAKEYLNSIGAELIVCESGESLEKMIKQIIKVTKIHGKAEQIVFSMHASEDGFILSILPPDNDTEQYKIKYITKAEIKNSLVPALQTALTSTGTVIFNICAAPSFTESLSDLDCLKPRADKNTLINLIPGKDIPLTPVYVEFSQNEYERDIKERLHDYA